MPDAPSQISTPCAPTPSVLPIQSPEAAPRFTALTRDWFHEVEPASPAFRIVLSATALEFYITARKKPNCLPWGRAGEFCEGLWQHDCGELFLGNPANGYYLEINLAPNGAWWTCLFEEPRMSALVENLPLDGVASEGLEGVAHWEARIRIPLQVLPPQLGDFTAPQRGGHQALVSTMVGNVCFSLGNAPKQRFLSFATPAPGNPDFHLPSQWLPFAIV